MSPPEKRKRKLLTSDADADGRTDRQGKHYMPFLPLLV